MNKKIIKVLVAVMISMAIFAAFQWDKNTVKYGTFKRIKNMKMSRTGHTTTLLKDGRVLIVGGFSDKSKQTAEIYDPKNGKFLSTGHAYLEHTRDLATLLPDGKVIIFKKKANHYNYHGRAEIFDPLTNEFDLIKDFNMPLDYYDIVLLKNGKILITGGVKQSNYNYEASLENGKILVTKKIKEPTLYSNKASIYDPKTNKITGVDKMLTPRAGHKSVLLSSGNVLIIGGTNIEKNGKQVGILTVEVYDPKTGKFSINGYLKTPKDSSQVIALKNDKVLIIGMNVTNNSLNEVVSIELYDPNYGKSFLVKTKKISGFSSSIQGVALNNNNVLLIEQDNAEIKAELYNPTKNSFSEINSSLYKRQYPELTLLNDGNVLITGGFDNDLSLFERFPSNIAELFISK